MVRSRMMIKVNVSVLENQLVGDSAPTGLARPLESGPMSYLVLARKYRPRNFTEMVGQDHVVQEMAVAKVKAAGHATDEFVHENPWKSIGIAAGVGLVVGLLVGRR